ncbi:prostaglandin E2 omega-hydroxylase CYP4F21-like [Magallana gigas]|uniref:prostaglandin E2 omega-hydroxylase CYP4F21-like n=1 Tax=Magallana gigas TaxID=29159 RepID=UPI0033423AF9
MSKEDIRSKVDTFMFEGHDITASAISWILFSLAENSICQRKCQEEIDKVIRETKFGQLKWKNLDELEYLHQRRDAPPFTGSSDGEGHQNSPRVGDIIEIPARTSILISIKSPP